jgi:hypothetical protein
MSQIIFVFKTYTVHSHYCQSCTSQTSFRRTEYLYYMHHVKMLIKEYHTSLSVKCMTNAICVPINEGNFVDASPYYIFFQVQLAGVKHYVLSSSNMQDSLLSEDMKTFLL